MTAEERLAIEKYKESTGKEIKELKALVARLGRENEALKAYSCKNLKCKERKSVKTCPNCGQIIG